MGFRGPENHILLVSGPGWAFSRSLFRRGISWMQEALQAREQTQEGQVCFLALPDY